MSRVWHRVRLRYPVGPSSGWAAGRHLVGVTHIPRSWRLRRCLIPTLNRAVLVGAVPTGARGTPGTFLADWSRL